MPPAVGDVIDGKYRLERFLGDGGMGRVFEAVHTQLSARVALKFLHPDLAKRQPIVDRFVQEAKIAARIHSPHVVRVSDVGATKDGVAYLVLEYVEGRTLQSLYDELRGQGNWLSRQEALSIAMQMLDGVEAAHDVGVIHRDLKPDNVMLARGGKGERVVKLLDFGIAKLKADGEITKGLTRPGVMIGTPEYMAPEQVYEASKVDARADVFSLGVMIFELLGGRRPVPGDDPELIATAHLTGRAAKLGEISPNLPPALVDAVHRAIAAKASDRFESVRAFHEALAPHARTLDEVRVTNTEWVSSSKAPDVAAAAPARQRDTPDDLSAPPSTQDDRRDGSAPPVTEDEPQPRRAGGTEIDHEGPSGTRPGDPAKGFDATAPMNPLGGASPTAPDPLDVSMAPARGRPPRRSSFVTMVALAALVTGAVLGVIWFAQHQGNDHGSGKPVALPTAAPPTTVPVSTGGAAPPPFVPPDGTTSPTATANAGHRPSIPGIPTLLPSTMPPIVIPSSLPPLPSGLPSALPFPIPSASNFPFPFPH